MHHQPQQVTQQLLKEHRTKANSFIRKARKYIRDDETVSRICSFYAAYHVMRYAILSDPLFDLPDHEFSRQVQMSRIATAMRLEKDSRFNSHHSAHANSERGIGQNQVILAMYTNRAGTYEQLHDTSIDARYVADAKEILLDASEAYYEAQKIVDDALAGKITWQMKH